MNTEAKSPSGPRQDARPQVKRVRTPESPASVATTEDQAERRRGRPRVDRADDPSAAERRRTQIRLAQRAYRQRKESTLESLRARVVDLSRALTRVNDAFIACRDGLAAGAQGLSADQFACFDAMATEMESAMSSVAPLDSGLELETEDVLERASVSAGKKVKVAASTKSIATTTTASPDESSPALPSTKEDQARRQHPSTQHNYNQAGRNVPSWMDADAVASSKRPRAIKTPLGYTMYPAEAVDDINIVQQEFGENAEVQRSPSTANSSTSSPLPLEQLSPGWSLGVG